MRDWQRLDNPWVICGGVIFNSRLREDYWLNKHSAGPCHDPIHLNSGGDEYYITVKFESSKRTDIDKKASWYLWSLTDNIRPPNICSGSSIGQEVKERSTQSQNRRPVVNGRHFSKQKGLFFSVFFMFHMTYLKQQTIFDKNVLDRNVEKCSRVDPGWVVADADTGTRQGLTWGSSGRCLEESDMGGEQKVTGSACAILKAHWVTFPQGCETASPAWLDWWKYRSHDRTHRHRLSTLTGNPLRDCTTEKRGWKDLSSVWNWQCASVITVGWYRCEGDNEQSHHRGAGSQMLLHKCLEEEQE